MTEDREDCKLDAPTPNRENAEEEDTVQKGPVHIDRTDCCSGTCVIMACFIEMKVIYMLSCTTCLNALAVGTHLGLYVALLQLVLSFWLTSTCQSTFIL